MLYPHRVKCPCGIEFDAIQPTAKFHSNACRCKAYRQRQAFAKNEPIPGLPVEVQSMYADLCEFAPHVGKMLVGLRNRRGPKCAAEAIMVALFCMRPELLSAGTIAGEFYRQAMPEYLKEAC